MKSEKREKSNLQGRKAGVGILWLLLLEGKRADGIQTFFLL